jgi:hypothetical protein
MPLREVEPDGHQAPLKHIPDPAGELAPPEQKNPTVQLTIPEATQYFPIGQKDDPPLDEVEPAAQK